MHTPWNEDFCAMASPVNKYIDDINANGHIIYGRIEWIVVAAMEVCQFIVRQVK